MKELSGYSDDELLAALDKARERRGRIEQEIEARFRERKVTAINTNHWRATQRQDTERYTFTTQQMMAYDLKVAEEYEQGGEIELRNAARKISRPYVSLSKKKTTTETPL